MFQQNHITRRSYYRNGREIPEVEAIDGDGTLLDGVTARVPLHMRDSVSRDRRSRIHDGSGDDCDPAALRRPGWRMSDTATRDAVEEAREQMILDAANAWRHPPQRHYTNDGNQERDPYSTIAADEEMTPSLRWKDSMTVDLADAREHHRIVTSEAIDEYVQRQSNAWREGK